MTLIIRDRFELPQDRDALEAAAAVALQHYAERAGLTVELDALPNAVRGVCDDLAARAPANGRIVVDWLDVARQLAELGYFVRLAEGEVEHRALSADFAAVEDDLALDRLRREIAERGEKDR